MALSRFRGGTSVRHVRKMEKTPFESEMSKTGKI
jgi:hypothetical protein